MANLLLWGHTLVDYKQMFDLGAQDLDKKIVDCGAGPASFNSDMHQLGKHVISCDELYQLSIDMLKKSIEKQFQAMHDEIANHLDKFNWDEYPNLAALTDERRKGMQRFFNDFERGLKVGRYTAEEASKLSFADASFDLALCLHYLFTIHAARGVDYHVDSIKEMARIAKEFRIFPLLDGDGEITPLLNPVLLTLQNDNYAVEIRQVPFHLHKKGNAMLVVKSKECSLD